MKTLGVMANILGTPCYNTVFVFILLKQINSSFSSKQVNQDIFMLLKTVDMHPV